LLHDILIFSPKSTYRAIQRQYIWCWWWKWRIEIYIIMCLVFSQLFTLGLNKLLIKPHTLTGTLHTLCQPLFKSEPRHQALPFSIRGIGYLLSQIVRLAYDEICPENLANITGI
jgi:hypothetical protein